MKYAEELKRLSRRHPHTLMYEGLKRDLKLEAQEGGNHKVIMLSKDNYNIIAKKLLTDGFEVIINNYKEDNESFMIFIVWDNEKFHEALKEATDIDKSTFHYGLI